MVRAQRGRVAGAETAAMGRELMAARTERTTRIRPVSRPRSLRTMQRNGPCLSTEEIPATCPPTQGREFSVRGRVGATPVSTALSVNTVSTALDTALRRDKSHFGT